MSNDANEERWYVQLDSGEVRTMTLEQLDSGFQEGLLHENSYVLLEGTTEWQTLGAVAGLGEDESEAPSVRSPAADPAPYIPAHSALQPVPAAQIPHVVAQHTRPALLESGWPPVAAAPVRPSYQPPISMMPVVQDVPNVDLDTASFNTGKRSLVFGGLAAVAVLGGGIFGLTRLDQPELPKPQAPVAAAMLPTATPWKPLVEPTPAAATASASQSESASSGKLSDDMKRALLAADKGRQEQKRGKRAAAPRSGGSRKGSGNEPFKSGGSQDDPLNPSL